MVLGVCTIDIYIPGVNSLKGKRGVLKSVIHRVRNKFNVSICELDKQELWKQATLGLACISNDRDMLHRIFSEVEKFIDSNGELQITDFKVQIM